ncbi:hypothetical protein N9E81_02205 [Algibacter sp.]|nr:hypothetical protein [Algibacter sp.]MDA9070222.1 hypothetical protein [Algibacter sp.]MDB0040967.1 hypothetical protein [Algibacter sp.]
MKKIILVVTAFIIIGCNKITEEKEKGLSELVEISKTPVLNLNQANKLTQLPLNCINIEYPNKLSNIKVMIQF